MKLRVKEYHRPVAPVALVFVFIGVALARQVTNLTYGYYPVEGDDITLIAPTPTASAPAPSSRLDTIATQAALGTKAVNVLFLRSPTAADFRTPSSTYPAPTSTRRETGFEATATPNATHTPAQILTRTPTPARLPTGTTSGTLAPTRTEAPKPTKTPKPSPTPVSTDLPTRAPTATEPPPPPPTATEPPPATDPPPPPPPTPTDPPVTPAPTSAGSLDSAYTYGMASLQGSSRHAMLSLLLEGVTSQAPGYCKPARSLYCRLIVTLLQDAGGW